MHEPDGVPDHGDGIRVPASPFNRVKLELGIILLLGLLLWLAADSITADADAQIGLLAGFGLAGMAWLVLRTRRVLHRHRGMGET